MPRTVQQRVSFQADIGFLTRLSQAVEIDERMTDNEKRQALALINSLSIVFHKVEARRLRGGASIQDEGSGEVETDTD